MNRNIIQVNPFKGLKIRTRQKASEQRKAFSEKDIKEVFDPKNVVPSPRRPSRYWIPVIAAYSGLRMEEIGQLEIGDFKEIDHELCLDIRQLFLVTVPEGLHIPVTGRDMTLSNLLPKSIGTAGQDIEAVTAA